MSAPSRENRSRLALLSDSALFHAAGGESGGGRGESRLNRRAAYISSPCLVGCLEICFQA